MKRYNKKFHKRQELTARQVHVNSNANYGRFQGSINDRLLEFIKSIRTKDQEDECLALLTEYMAENGFETRKRSDALRVLPRGQDQMGKWAYITVEETKVKLRAWEIEGPEHRQWEVDLHDPESLEKIMAIANFITSQ